MTSLFDHAGWFTTDTRWGSRVAPVAPAIVPGDRVVGTPFPNWTGYEWVMLAYVEVPEPQEPPPPEPVVYTKLTKRAFQERFPLTSNGVSRKYDRMDLFLRDDGYAASLGVTGAGLYELRLLITTGINRLNVSSHVDLALPDAANFLTLLMNPGIPEAFRLTAEERQEMLDAPVRPEERFE